MAQNFDFSHLGPESDDAQSNKYDFSHLGPSNDLPVNNIQSTSPKHNFGLPNLIAKSIVYGESALKNPFTSLPDRLAAGKRGLQDIWEGVKGLGLSAGEGLGMVKPGSSEQYSKERQKEREEYDTTHKDAWSNLIRSAINTAPYAAIGGPLGMETGLLTKAALGGLTGAGVGAAQFVAPGQSRAANIAGGTALGVAGPALSAVGKVIEPLFFKGSPQKTASIIQKGHDVLDKQAGDLYDYVTDEVKKRGIDKMPIPDKLINESERFFPNTDASKNLINKAKGGDYESIRKLQSDLRYRGQEMKESDLASERDKGDEAFDLRNKINNEVADTFNVFGHPDLQEKLSEANNIYRNMKDTYYDDNTIAKLVNPKKREVPQNINNVVMKISEPMKKVRMAHPELEQEVTLANKKKNAIKLLKGLGYFGGAAEIWRHGEDIQLLKKLLGNE